MSSPFKYSFKTKTRESLSMAVYNSGYQQCQPGYQWGPALRDHYLLHHIMSGSGSYTVGGNTYELHAGQTFLVYPGEVVSYKSSTDDPWEYCWVGWSGSEAVLLMEHTAFSRERPVTTFPHPDRIESCIMDIYGSSGSGLISQTKMIGMLYLFVAELIEQSGGEKMDSNPSSQYLKNAMRFITYNYSRQIDINSISASVGISRSHLYRVFISGMGISPNQYLMRFRIEQACTLLKTTSLSIANIASSVGFDDQLYFSRVFKKITGISPAIYSGRRQPT